MLGFVVGHHQCIMLSRLHIAQMMDLYLQVLPFKSWCQASANICLCTRCCTAVQSSKQKKRAKSITVYSYQADLTSVTSCLRTHEGTATATMSCRTDRACVILSLHFLPPMRPPSPSEPICLSSPCSAPGPPICCSMCGGSILDIWAIWACICLGSRMLPIFFWACTMPGRPFEPTIIMRMRLYSSAQKEACSVTTAELRAACIVEAPGRPSSYRPPFGNVLDHTLSSSRRGSCTEALQSNSTLHHHRRN